MTCSSTPYIGRFAPSPSGPLHFGSLITALASYLDAKHYSGKWLVRMEDLDPPREEKGAQERILESLVAHGLHWDEQVIYQSQRLNHYLTILKALDFTTYRCKCARQRLLELRGVYDSHCYHHRVDDNSDITTSTRLYINPQLSNTLSISEHYTDLFQGEQQQSLQKEVGDFILRRKDGLIAYQLAVVIDDIEQGITHIIRGSDLLTSTPRQRYLMLLLLEYGITGNDTTAHIRTKTNNTKIKQTDNTTSSIHLPFYGHIPVATNAIGQKLSKQHKATAIDNTKAFDNLCSALLFLNQPLTADIRSTKDIGALLRWATERWDRKSIPNRMSFVVEQ